MAVRALAVIPALGLTLLVGCGGAKKQPDVRAAITTKARTCAEGSFQRLGSSRLAYAAIVRSRATVSRRPGTRAFASFRKLNVNRVPTIFSIRGALVDATCKPRSYLVQIPKRPNGVTAWVPAGQVDVAKVSTRIVVDLSEKRVTLYKDGKKVLSSTAAIGAPATPTPTGRFYVNQRLDPRGQGRPVRPRRGRRLGVLGRPDRLDAGRPDRDPRDQRAVVDRQGRLERLHPHSEPRAEEAVRPGVQRHAGPDPGA